METPLTKLQNSFNAHGGHSGLHTCIHSVLQLVGYFRSTLGRAGSTLGGKISRVSDLPLGHDGALGFSMSVTTSRAGQFWSTGCHQLPGLMPEFCMMPGSLEELLV